MEQTYKQATWQSDDGLTLFAKDWPSDGSACPPLLCLAGLTRNSNDFERLAEYLSKKSAGKRRIIAFDYRGRGRSDYDPDKTNYSFERELADIIQGLDALDLDRVDILGTSRGGIHIMLLANVVGDRIGKVILNDIGPEIFPAGLKRISQHVGKEVRFDSFEQAADYLKSRERTFFPGLSDEDWLYFARQTYRQSGVGIVINYDPDLSEVFKDWSEDSDPIDLWPQFNALREHATLVIRGELSNILTVETVTKMKTVHPALQSHTVLAQGHAPLLIKPETFGAIERFLNASDAF